MDTRRLSSSLALVAGLAGVALVSGCAENGLSVAGGVDVVEAEPVRATTTTLVVELPPAPNVQGAVQLGPDPDPSISVELLVEPEPEIVRPLTVAIVGDSLTVSAEDEIVNAIGATQVEIVGFDAMESRRMVNGARDLPSGAEAIASIGAELEESPGAWVVALGTNDVASFGNSTEFRTAMQELLAQLPRDVPVIWVDVFIRDRDEASRTANGVIRSELEQWSGGSVVVDWYAHGDGEGNITSDGVHLTQSGQDLFAASIVAAIGELYAPAE